MKEIQNLLLCWFKREGRALPWRVAYAPYQIWVSEIMLQQTQVDRVVRYFLRWIRAYPRVQDVAKAEEQEILRHWQGLGYYSRARSIRKAARIIVFRYNGSLPAEHNKLLTLPGIGPYTAGAIMSLGFNKEYPVVDANVERFFSRFFNIGRCIDLKEVREFLWKKAKEMIPCGQARAFNQAMMELGALICKAKNPGCPVCPVRDFCQAYLLKVVAKRPVKKRKPSRVAIEMAACLFIKEKSVLIKKRGATGLWANLWEFPNWKTGEGSTPEETIRKELLESWNHGTYTLERLGTIKPSYTIYNVTLHCFVCRLGDDFNTEKKDLKGKWVPVDTISQFPFSSAHMKLSGFLEDEVFVADCI
ncbi:MAG: A/G-specific adenine glycosylase [Nitrospinota bacterium]